MRHFLQHPCTVVSCTVQPWPWNKQHVPGHSFKNVACYVHNSRAHQRTGGCIVYASQLVPHVASVAMHEAFRINGNKRTLPSCWTSMQDAVLDKAVHPHRQAGRVQAVLPSRTPCLACLTPCAPPHPPPALRTDMHVLRHCNWCLHDHEQQAYAKA